MSDLRDAVWLPSEALRRHANRTVSGDPEIDWLTHVRRRHFAVPPRRVLVLGAGEGYLEVSLARHFPDADITGVDGDAAAIARARDRAGRRGLARVVHHARGPAEDPVPPGPWDAVFGRGVAHRAAAPDRLLRSVHDALAPHGRAVFSEYAGPSDPDGVPRWGCAIGRYVRVLPIGLRFDPESGLPFARDLRTAPDPSPAPSPFLDAARAVFVEEGVYRGGGGLLQPLLGPAVARNPRPPEGLDERLLEFLGAAEDDLYARGLLTDAFAIFVGRRRAAAAG